jgi:hypothetical protein
LVHSLTEGAISNDWPKTPKNLPLNVYNHPKVLEKKNDKARSGTGENDIFRAKPPTMSLGKNSWFGAVINEKCGSVTCWNTRPLLCSQSDFKTFQVMGFLYAANHSATFPLDHQTTEFSR